MLCLHEAHAILIHCGKERLLNAKNVNLYSYLIKRLTWIDGFELMLDHSDHADAGYYGNTNHLQPNVQPLHGSITVEETSLILFYTPLILLLKSALKHIKIKFYSGLQITISQLYSTFISM